MWKKERGVWCELPVSTVSSLYQASLGHVHEAKAAEIEERQHMRTRVARDGLC